MQIPDQIKNVDIRIKQLLMLCYNVEKSSLKKFLDACTTPKAKEDVMKYWRSIPIRLIKKGYNIKIDNSNADIQKTIESTTKRRRKRITVPHEEIKLPIPQMGKTRIKKFLGGDYSEKKISNALIKFDIYSPDAITTYIDELKKERQQKKTAKKAVKQCPPKNKTSSSPSLKHPSIKIKKSTPLPDGYTCEIVPWEAIEFRTECVWIYDYKLNGEIVLKSQGHLTIACKGTRDSFNKIKKLFIDRLPDIKAYVRNGHIKRLASNIELENAIRIMQDIDTNEDWNVDETPFISPSTLKAINNIDYDQVLRNLRRKKSKFLDHLISIQKPSKKVVPCKELLSYSNNAFEEDAFIFTLESYKKNLIILILENVNIARSTIAFIVEKEYFEKALRVIFDFIRSSQLNKRQRLHYRRFDFTDSGILKYICINHTSLYDWSCKIRNLY